MKRIILMGFLFFLFISPKSNGQDLYKLHSIFIYNFSKFIDWPQNYKSGDFVIGVLGDSPITEHLKQMASNKMTGTQRFSIKNFSNPGDLEQCHILYIPKSLSSKFEECRDKLVGQPTLIITDKPGLGETGSGINFLLVDGKPRFELNKSYTEERKLKVSSELSKLAILI